MESCKKDPFQENKQIVIDNFRSRKTKLGGFPSSLSLCATDSCNLRCFMCSIGQRKGCALEINREGLQHVIDVFPYLETVTMGGGEIFYDKGNPAGLVARILEAGGKHPHLKFGGVSNATLIDDKRARLIVEKFKWINVSIDSPDPAIYPRIRIGSNLALVRRNMKRITDLKVANGLSASDPPQLGLCFIIMGLTYKSVPDMVKFGLETGAHFIQVQTPWEGSIPPADDILTDSDKTRVYLSGLRVAEKLAAAGGIKIRDRTRNVIYVRFPAIRHIFDVVNNVDSRSRVQCRVPYERIDIDVHGDVRFCCTSPTILGNINVHSVVKIWNSSSAVMMRQRLLENEFRLDCMRDCVEGHDLPNSVNPQSVHYFLKRTRNFLIRHLRSVAFFSSNCRTPRGLSFTPDWSFHN